MGKLKERLLLQNLSFVQCYLYTLYVLLHLREDYFVLKVNKSFLCFSVFYKTFSDSTSAQASIRAKLKHISQRSETIETNQDSLSSGERSGKYQKQVLRILYVFACMSPMIESISFCFQYFCFLFTHTFLNKQVYESWKDGIVAWHINEYFAILNFTHTVFY
ncbi:MAG: hypothetical protein GY775_05410 [Candidatus Scalindua sp.]|nr:hypothetical protein [Candidatus Scalindua sp.]